MDCEFTFPPLNKIESLASSTPDYMRPNDDTPHVFGWEGALSDDICDNIIETLMSINAYKFRNCGGMTRECPRPLDSVLAPIRLFGLSANNRCWNFDLDSNTPGAWLQTYETGEQYHIHADASIGQTRKLTVVAILSSPSDYDGGFLRVVPYPEFYEVPRTRGTLVAFPPWLLHEVTPVTRGRRQTINLGFWGPRFI